MSKKRLRSLRAAKFESQSGRCFYCDLPMWLWCPTELGLRPRSAAPFQCTAEHLVPKQDGGKDTASNVVAAHACCNHRRHQRLGPAPSPESFRALVQRRVIRGKWWSSLPPRIARAPV